MKRGKKAISDVIILVLIVLISIVAVLLTWNLIKPQFQQGSQEISQKSAELSSLDLKITKLNLEDNSLKISVQNNGERQIVGFTLRISSPQGDYFNDSVYLINNRTLSSLEEGIIIITPAPFGQDQNNYTKLELFPKFISDEKIKTSSISTPSETFVTNSSGNNMGNTQTIYYKDLDNDGYSDGVFNQSRLQGYNLSSELKSSEVDCHDTNLNVHPNAIEICDAMDNDCDGIIDEDQSPICINIYNESLGWFNYTFGSKILRVSPMLDAGSNNEINHHRVVIEYTGTGSIKASIGHYTGTNFSEVMDQTYRYTSFTSIASGIELTAHTPCGERYAWLILDITGNVSIKKINHTHWVGFNTLYGHEPATFDFANGTLRYRIMYPRNFNSSSGKKYPLVISCPGSGGIGNNNRAQMEMVGIGRYLFEYYYFDPEFEAISIVVQPDSYANNPAPYYVHGSLGIPGQYQDSWFRYTQENGYYVSATKALVNQMLSNSSLNIDPKRVYFSGFSLGGMATYEFMKKMNDTLAAAWSVGGWPIGNAGADYTNRNQTDPMIIQLKSEVQRYKNIPLQACSGSADVNVGPYGATLACREINAAGGNCTLYIFPGVDHVGSAGTAYSDINKVRWLFSQTKSY